MRHPGLRLSLRLLLLLLALSLLPGCQSRLELREGDVSFLTSDGVRLAGTVISKAEDADLAVVLVHFQPFETDPVRDFYQALAKEGVTVFAFRFRGISPSEGHADVNAAPEDLRAAYRFLRENGYRRFICIGASMGGTACLEDARETGLVGLATLSAPLQITDAPLSAADFAGLNYPRLFEAAETEGSGAQTARALYAMAGEPKDLLIYPGSGAHGTAMFGTKYGSDLSSRLVALVRTCKKLP